MHDENAPAVPATSPAGENAWTRPVLGALVIAAGLGVFCWCFSVVFHAETDVKDVIAVLGAVTPFLSTVIGIYFGISAGQATAARASDVAAHANEVARQATATAARQAGVMDTVKSSLLSTLPPTEHEHVRQAFSGVGAV